MIEREGNGKLYIGSQDDSALLNQIVADAKAAGSACPPAPCGAQM